MQYFSKELGVDGKYLLSAAEQKSEVMFTLAQHYSPKLTPRNFQL